MPKPPRTDAAAQARKARFWNWIARRYAALNMSDPAGYEASMARVIGLISPEHDVLELGCGTGSTALRLAPHTGHLLATDFSPDMLAIARERLREQPVSQLEFALADADDPGTGQACHDRVLAFNLLHLTTDLDAALTNVARALRPGGLLISKTPCIAELNPFVVGGLRVLMPVLRAVGRAPHMRFLDEPRLRAAMERAGLRVLASERHGTRGKDVRPFIVARKPDEGEARAGT
ncbi:MAG: class I SAM-dependent methyltransferase [Pseudomonadota bacterium]|nr:class I SAM-dependent methyltransferase [Pseudomonadota bacterium]